ncbi:MAG: DUF1904 family protein [Firmicutes bacterium]|jgi:hypothetical protein|nr:DUF1904 family protein [Bacillota bacterium]
MPTLVFRGVKPSDLQTLAQPLIEKLSQVAQCEKRVFTLELTQTTHFDESGLIESYPMIEVHWFDRPQEQQDEAAQVIADFMKNLGYKRVKVSFIIIDRTAFYDFK